MNRQTPKSNKRVALYTVLLAISLIAMIMLGRMSHNPEVTPMSMPSGGDTIDVAIEYSPLSLYTIDDTLGGFNYDLIRAIAAMNKLHVKFHPIANFGTAAKKLDDGLYDLIVADIASSSEIQKDFSLTEPTFMARQVLVQPKLKDGETLIKSPLDLAKKTIYISKNSPALFRIKNLSDEIGDSINVIESEYGSEQLILAVAAGEISSAVVNENIAKDMADRFPAIDISTCLSFNQFQSWLIRKDDISLKNKIDSMIRSFKNEAAYGILLKRYGLERP